MTSAPPSFESPLWNFTERLHALSDLTEAVTPHLNELYKRPAWTSEVDAALKSLAPDRRNVALDILILLPDLWLELMQRHTDRVAEIAKTINAMDESFQLEVTPTGVQVLTTDRAMAKPLVAFIDGIKRTSHSPPHAVLLRRSLLTMAVGAFEHLVGNLLRIQLRMHTGLLNSDDKEFSLSELLVIGSIDEAVEALIARRVDDFTRRGIDEWAKWFAGDSLKISMSQAAQNWQRVREVFERRNLVVHHNCRVTTQYLSKVHSSLREGVATDDHLEVSEEYLNEAIDELMSLGMVLGIRMWAKLTKDTEKPSDWLSDRQLDLLRRGRPSTAIHLGTALEPSRLDPQTQLVVQVNAWIGRKALSGVSAITDEVQAWDVRALSSVFRVAKSALLDEHESASEGVRMLLDREELHEVDLRDWPLFKELRSSGLIDDLLALPQLEAPPAELPAEAEAVESDTANDSSPESLATEQHAPGHNSQEQTSPSVESGDSGRDTADPG